MDNQNQPTQPTQTPPPVPPVTPPATPPAVPPVTPPITPPVPPQKPAGSKLPMVVGIILVIVALLVSGAYYILLSKNTATPLPKMTPTPTQAPSPTFAPTATSVPASPSASMPSSVPSAFSCKNIDRNSSELTFAISYCNGDLCAYAKDQATCEAKDVVKIENNTVVSGTDGTADCAWNATVNTCGANK
jgi:hypothetical protein